MRKGKKIVAILSTLLVSASALALIGCEKKEEKEGLQFNERYQTVFNVEESIDVDEFIDPDLYDDYTFVVIDQDGKETDLTNRGTWLPRKLGKYTLRYTVNSGDKKGTIETEIVVKAPQLDWNFKRKTIIFYEDETIQFADLENILNVSVMSYFDPTFYVKTIKYNGEYTDVSNQDSYKFTKAGSYTFRFAVKTEDGQELSDEQIIVVRDKQVLGEGAKEWLEENNIELYDHKSATADGEISLYEGYYDKTYLADNVPYVAFKGDYGPNTYAMFEFTGKNLPQVTLFADKIVPSITDGSKGIYVHNGLTKNNGTTFSPHDRSRVTLFGPNKVSFGEIDNRGRLNSGISGNPGMACPMSWEALKEDNKYRYIVGVSNVENEGTDQAKFTIQIMLINLTTAELEFDWSYTSKTVLDQVVSGMPGNPFKNFNFSGNIIAYGRYGMPLKLDKIYMPKTGVSDIHLLDVAAPIKTTARTQYALGELANVADFIDIPTGDYEFKVVAPDGTTEKISATTLNFKFNQGGKYYLIFDNKQEGVRPNSVAVDVFDPYAERSADYYENDGIIISAGIVNGTMNEKKKDSDYIIEGDLSIKYSYVKTGAADWSPTSVYGVPMALQRKHLDQAFASQAVTAFTFKVWVDHDTTYRIFPAWKSTGRLNYLPEKFRGVLGELKGGEWNKITITRELWQAAKHPDFCAPYALNWDLAFGFGEENIEEWSFYVDDFQMEFIQQDISANAKAFMTENGMTSYYCKEITDDMSATIYSGTYSGQPHAIQSDNVGYIAYNGNYGQGSYIVADFTGKCIPQLAFFVKEVSPSLVDGEQGVYIHTGFNKTADQYYSDTDCGRVTFFGPNKVQYRRFDADGRYAGQFGSATDPSPMSVRGLQDGTHYRYVVGVKAVETGKITLELMLINLDTHTLVAKYEKVLEDTAFTQDFCTGSIVMYGRYSVETKLDKIYKAYTDVTDVNEIDLVKDGLMG